MNTGISTFGFDGHTATSGYLSIIHLLMGTFFEFGVVENCFFRSKITVILQIHSVVSYEYDYGL